MAPDKGEQSAYSGYASAKEAFTIRDVIAVKAISAAAAHLSHPEDIARAAYEIADAMLRERVRKP